MLETMDLSFNAKDFYKYVYIFNIFIFYRSIPFWVLTWPLPISPIFEVADYDSKVKDKKFKMNSLTPV